MTDKEGELVSHVEYTPFGELRHEQHLGVSVNHLYTGQEYDREIGLYYYHARYYDAKIGRFIQPDVIVPDPADHQAYNRYSYVRNNPIMLVDPTGNQPEDEIALPGVDDGFDQEIEDMTKAELSTEIDALWTELEAEFGLERVKLGSSRDRHLIRLRLLYLLLTKGQIHPVLQQKMVKYNLSNPLAYFNKTAKRIAKHEQGLAGLLGDFAPFLEMALLGPFLGGLAQFEEVRPYVGTALAVALTAAGVPAPLASAAGGATSAYFSGGSAGDVVAGGAIGAAAGYASGLVPGSGNLAKIAQATTYGAVSGGGYAAVGGGNVLQGAAEGAAIAAGMAITFAGLDWLYRTVVDYAPTAAPGGPAQAKTANQDPIAGANNVGNQGLGLGGTGLFDFREGSRWSRVLNSVPGINATAGMHDVFQINLPNGFVRSVALNYPGMPVAAALSYGALMHGQPHLSNQIYRDHI